MYKFTTSLLEILRHSTIKLPVAMNKDRKHYTLYGVGPHGKAIVWDGISEHVDLVDLESAEWLHVTTIGD